MKRRSLAIVGTGISGMTVAHYLRDKYRVSLFEKNSYLGGHTHTHRMDGFTLDTGFIVFNLRTYKNLLKLFGELGVEKRKSDMSFSVHNLDTGLQYSSSGFPGIFAQKRNLASFGFWRFLFQINRFFKVAMRDYRKVKGSKESIRDYCHRNGLSDYFIDNYLVPMSSAVWSTPTKDTYDFPIALLLPFFFNHGLLGVNQPFQWFTVKGGSDTYTRKIAEGLDIHLNEGVKSCREEAGKVLLKTVKGDYEFDNVVLAGHADDSLRIVKGLSEAKKEMLSAFSYNANKAVLHTDSSIMPTNRRVWSSWNHVIKGDNASTVYWLNMLQKPDTDTDYFVSINPFQKIDKKKVVKEIRYNHPLYTIENFALQDRLQELNEDTRIYFCGSYFGYGFHEDGCKSGMEVVERLK